MRYDCSSCAFFFAGQPPLVKLAAEKHSERTGHPLAALEAKKA